MKYVLLSHDFEPSVYLVPDIVADNLAKYFCEFADKWLWESPHAEEYRQKFREIRRNNIDINGDTAGVCYGEHDFIKYLNTWVFPDNPSVFIETLTGVRGDWDLSPGRPLPEKYKNCEWFNF